MAKYAVLLRRIDTFVEQSIFSGVNRLNNTFRSTQKLLRILTFKSEVYPPPSSALTSSSLTPRGGRIPSQTLPARTPDQ
jgi:hypothetical protein